MGGMAASLAGCSSADHPRGAGCGLAGTLLKLWEDRLSLRAEAKDMGDDGVTPDSADADADADAETCRSMRALRGLSLLAADPLLIRDSGSACLCMLSAAMQY